MITKITPIEELKQIFTESLLNHTDKVTKVSDGSVLNGIAYGISKLSQKVLKDVAVIEAHLFPDTAVGICLDDIAKLRGIAPRLGQTKSTVFVRVVGDAGTVYTPGTQVFSGSGVNFDLLEPVTIPDCGYTYINLISQQVGLVSNVAALTITKVNPKPVGHQYVINEFSATGGRNIEDDDDFRKRIKDEVNVIARGTLSYLEQVFRKYEPNVLRIFNLGLDNEGDLNLAIASVNGVDFTTSQLSNMLMKGEQYLSMNEFKPNGLNNYGIKLKNVTYFPIDISFRVDIDNSYNYDLVRKEIQVSLNKVADFRYWQDGDWIDWIDLINCVKSTNGVKRVLDNFFFPNTQIEIPRGKLPRIRGFQMMDLKGQILVDLQGNLNPIFYPNINDFAYQATILKSL
jgi:hypothetical protein